MPRLKRSGKTETFSVSVSPETKAQLRRVAKQRFGGNVSALIESIAAAAVRQEALDRLLERSPPIDEAAYAEFLEEMRGPRPRRRSRAA